MTDIKRKIVTLKLQFRQYSRTYVFHNADINQYKIESKFKFKKKMR